MNPFPYCFYPPILVTGSPSNKVQHYFHSILIKVKVETTTTPLLCEALYYNAFDLGKEHKWGQSTGHAIWKNKRTREQNHVWGMDPLRPSHSLVCALDLCHQKDNLPPFKKDKLPPQGTASILEATVNKLLYSIWYTEDLCRFPFLILHRSLLTSASIRQILIVHLSI